MSGKRLLYGVFALALIGLLGLFINSRTENLRQGVTIGLENPKESTSTVSGSLIDISGTVVGATEILVAGAPVLPDTKGNFLHRLVLAPGYNRVIVSARDRFDKEDSKELTIYYQTQEQENAQEERSEEGLQEGDSEGGQE